MFLLPLLVVAAQAAAAPARRAYTDLKPLPSTTAEPEPTHSDAHALSDKNIETYTIIACSVAGGLLIVLAIALCFVYRYYHPQHLRARAPYASHQPRESDADKASVKSGVTEPLSAPVAHDNTDYSAYHTDYAGYYAHVDGPGHDSVTPPPKVRRVLGIEPWKP
ncbi:hypothetical protein Q8F55_002962 [Vanrija albida]|uniref:Mid2 domain-containing protein n=1 Tax=Vanrija albida TaxID=181172 RepID=A0ABR3QB62_9TREE